MTEPTKNPGGRPRKDNPKLMQEVLKGIKAGLSYEGACGLAKVSYRTFLRRRELGEKNKSGRFWQFCQELEYAEAVAEAGLLKRIKEDPDTKYACWILERRHPDRWGRQDRVKQELTGKDGGMIVLHFDKEDAGL